MGLAQLGQGIAAWFSPTPATPQVGKAAVAAPVNATAAQLGNAATPAVHTSTAALPTHTASGGAMPTSGPAVAIPTPSARYRARPSYAVSPEPGTTASATPIPAQHLGRGAADPRDQFGGGAGMTGSPEILRPASEVLTNAPDALEVVGRSATPAPSVTRAGSTGADPSRPSRRPFVGWLRAFDQSAVYGQGTAVGKLPLVITPSLPISQSQDTAGGLPSAGGSGMTGQAGVGGQPNTYRLMPNKWDENLINTGGTGDTGTAAVAGRRTSGWRARG